MFGEDELARQKISAEAWERRGEVLVIKAFITSPGIQLA
jgi:hypothetical protein